MATFSKRIIIALRKIESQDPHFSHFDERDFKLLLDEAGIKYESIHHEPVYPLPEDPLRPRHELLFKIVDEEGSELEVHLIFNWQYRTELIMTKAGWL